MPGSVESWSLAAPSRWFERDVMNALFGEEAKRYSLSCSRSPCGRPIASKFVFPFECSARSFIER